MASLGAIGEAGAGGDAAHGERIAFERLLADLSARCANAARDEILGVIEASLEQLVAFLGYDRCSYAEFAADGTLHVLCSATADGVEPIARGRFGADLPWFVGELRSGRAIKLSRLPARLASEGFTPPVVFLTGHGDLATGVDAMKLGAVDFLAKPVEQEVLVAAVRKALERHDGERKRLLERAACRALVIQGKLNKQIAADLDIAEQTVKQHRGQVMEKMVVRSVPELISVCNASGLFSADDFPLARGPAP